MSPLTLPTFGFVAKEFEVMGWSFSLRGGVILTLRETAAAIFDHGTGFTTPDVAANTLLPKPDVVEQITGVTDQWHEHGGRQVDPRAHHGELDGGGVGGGAPARAHRGAVHARRRYAAERRLAERFRAR